MSYFEFQKVCLEKLSRLVFKITIIDLKKKCVTNRFKTQPYDVPLKKKTNIAKNKNLDRKTENGQPAAILPSGGRKYSNEVDGLVAL